MSSGLYQFASHAIEHGVDFGHPQPITQARFGRNIDRKAVKFRWQPAFEDDTPAEVLRCFPEIHEQQKTIKVSECRYVYSCLSPAGAMVLTLIVFAGIPATMWYVAYARSLT